RRADAGLAARAERPAPRARHEARRLRGSVAGRGAAERAAGRTLRGLLLSRLARRADGAGALRGHRPGERLRRASMTSIELSPVEGSRELFLPLLLEADESEPIVRTYLEDGELFAIL